VIGWFADLFRLAWGLLYWNTRKSLFRLRRGRTRPPCQSPSDSGRAMETHCDACLHWHKPARFQRVCPLLAMGKDGWVCSANAAEVRPFWGGFVRYYGATLVATYTVIVLTVFVFLRTVGYPVSILHVGFPFLWHKVPQARGAFFLEKSNRAFATGKTSEGLIYLNNAYQFDPSNYGAGLSLAKNYQAGQPRVSDEFYARLLRDHPDHRDATSQEWFRALLARGDFPKAAQLALTEMPLDAARAQVWLRSLLFTTHHWGDDAPLRQIAASRSPGTVVWHNIVETELLLRSGRRADALAALEKPWPAQSPSFAIYYQIDMLISLGRTFAALDLLAAQPPGKIDDEAALTLRLKAYATGKNPGLLGREFDRVLVQLNPPRIKTLCAHLIRYPDLALFERLCTRLERNGMVLSTETAAVWFTLLCTAGAVGDDARLHDFSSRLKQASSNPFVALAAIEAFFRGTTVEKRITSFLPILPLPLEVNYALIERYPGPPRPAAAAAPTRRP
jgi:tetratricopeptide (TPR) repeat protein